MVAALRPEPFLPLWSLLLSPKSQSSSECLYYHQTGLHWFPVSSCVQVAEHSRSPSDLRSQSTQIQCAGSPLTPPLTKPTVAISVGYGYNQRLCIFYLQICKIIRFCCIRHPQGPPGSFDFLLLLMADIRNDIADLQSRVYGRPMHSPTEDFPSVPDSWMDSEDNLDAGSGQNYKEVPPRTGGGSKRNKKRKPAQERTDFGRTS